MGYVERKYIRGIGYRELHIHPYKTDMKCFKVVKSRQEHSCGECGKKIPSKSYMYSSDWIKLCLGCGEAFSHKGLEGYQKIIKYIKANQKILKQNKEKWEAQNIMASL